MTTGTADTATDARDTFPKLLAERARTSPDRPAYREKEYGIWQSHSWRHVAAEIRLFAAGLADQGFRRGDRLIVVGDNRPLLYWSMCAAQSLGGVPVPVYQDSVADELAYVVEHAGARFALAENQEQVDKLLEIQKKVPTLEVVMYQDPRGMRHYEGLLSVDRGAATRRQAARDDARSRLRRGRPGPRRGRRHHALHLGHDGTAQGRGAELRQPDLGRQGRRRLRRPEGGRRASVLPADGVGRRPHLLLRPVLRRRAGGELPRIGGHGDDRPARDRPDLLLRAAARAGEPDHPGDDPHGGCGLHQAPPVPLFHGAGAQGRAGTARRPAGVADRPAALCAGQPR